MNKKRISIVVALLGMTVLLSTCGLIPLPEFGTVVLSFGAQDLLSAKTIEPQLDMDPATYDVYGTGPGGASFEVLGLESTEIAQASLIPGEWTIYVEAFNADTPPTLIGSGTATVTVLAGEVLTVTVVVQPIVGTGQLEVIVQWPAGVLLNPQVTGTLTPMGGTGGAIVFGLAPDELSASYASPAIGDVDALANGYYMVSVALSTDRPDGSGTDVVWGTVESVRIITGEVSQKTYELVEDVNRGGVEVIIEPELDNPIEITIEGVQTPLQTGVDMTVSASPSGQDAYAWYLDGVLMVDGLGDPLTGSTITFGSDVGLGYHWLSVVVTSGSVTSSAAEVFHVVAGSSLWGTMVWGQDVWG